MFCALTWDPDRNFFVVPYIRHPVTWYGVLFAFGFIVAYFLTRRIMAGLISVPERSPAENKLKAITLTDRGVMLVIIATVIGARLGHVFFYGWTYYRQNPLDIFKVWEGGLASHGGAIGVLIALLIFVWWHRKEFPQITYLSVLDMAAIPTAFVGGCIRVGNFINQEITGVPTDLPWGVVFMHPLHGFPGVAVHPVQLYEAIFYFLTFIFLFILWKWRPKSLGFGLAAGWFLSLVFTFRFFIEYLKIMPSDWVSEEAALSMGQLLSIPFALAGIILLVFYYSRREIHTPRK